jgi:hypothetical protein
MTQHGDSAVHVPKALRPWGWRVQLAKAVLPGFTCPSRFSVSLFTLSFTPPPSKT